jgi:hypothetical protein
MNPKMTTSATEITAVSTDMMAIHGHTGLV